MDFLNFLQILWAIHAKTLSKNIEKKGAIELSFRYQFFAN